VQIDYLQERPMPLNPSPEENDRQPEPQTQPEPARGGGGNEPPRPRIAVGCGDDSNEFDLDSSGGIRDLLSHISAQSGVQGSVIVGHDGAVFAHNLPDELNPASIGLLALGIFSNVDSTKGMGYNKLHQLVCRTQNGYVVIAHFGNGFLVTVSDVLKMKNLIKLMRTVTQLVAS
jgi:predicted regulator of Ras-like GTPase activity (Roadblock/LC7/MglB family)